MKTKKTNQRKIKKDNSLFLKLNDNENDKISYWVKCASCKNDLGISTTYKQISDVYEQNAPLTAVCPKCNGTINIDTDSLKNTIEELPTNKKSHLKGYLHSLKDNKQTVERYHYQPQAQQPVIIQNEGSGLLGILIFIIIVILFFYFIWPIIVQTYFWYQLMSLFN